MLSEMMRSCHTQQEDGQGAPARRRGWSKTCRGRLQGRRTGGAGGPRGRHHQHHHQHHHHHPGHLRRWATALRPVNGKGNRVRGMRAPKNTNQFLMHEKYQMQHMRSDSVGSDSGSSSDSDLELTDMDSYLGVLENARGALLDSPTTPPPSGQPVVLREDGLRLHEEDGLRLQGDSLRLQEDSMQYFPSEDDLMQSQNFMQRDFAEFCHILTS